ncbi:MAG: NtrZ family periplasmic regulatory protein [Hyphomonadaceae bacterium]
MAPTVEATNSGVPWYQRFTTSNGVTETITGQAEDDRLAPAWTLNQRWGITVDVREAQRIERLPDGRGDQASVGAFYQFTPNISVGGQLNLETTPAPGAVARPQEEEPRADVRIESAFRF